MTAHRWNVPKKPREEQQFFVSLPSSGKVACIKENDHGFQLGGIYTFTAEMWANYFPPSHKIVVNGRYPGGQNWIFIYRDSTFHTYFSILP